MDIDELRRRIDSGAYDGPAGFDAEQLRADIARRPAPDPSQGHGGTTGAGDFRTASTEDFHAELRRLGVNPRNGTR